MTFQFKQIGLILLIILTVTELLLTLIIGVNQRPLYQADDTIEYLLQSNQQLTRFGNQYDVNEHHMRSAPFPDDYFGAGKLRIMVYGDSIINGGTKLDQNEIATSLLQKQLSEQQINAYVGNISAGSWGPENILEYIRKHGTYKADVAIVVLSSHDAFDVPTFTELGRQSHPIQHNNFSFYELYLKYIAKRSPFIASANVQQQKKAIQQNNENNKLTELILSLKKQVKTILIVQHYSMRELKKEALPLGHKIINKSCVLTKVICIDLLSAYSNSVKNIYLDDLHLNTEGQRLLSSAFQNLITQNVLNEIVYGNSVEN